MDKDIEIIKLGIMVLFRDIFKFISIISVGYSSGIYLGALFLKTVDRISVTRVIWLEVLGLIFLILYMILRHKSDKLCTKISDMDH